MDELHGIHATYEMRVEKLTSKEATLKALKNTKEIKAIDADTTSNENQGNQEEKTDLEDDDIDGEVRLKVELVSALEIGRLRGKIKR